jgi:LmbE family N-acetylglucosaminyl deacetylase
MKLMFIHAHFDDYEFTAAGTFEMWRHHHGPGLQRLVLVCTDGQSGHHYRTRAETGRIRLEEQRASARLGGYDFAMLQLPDGRVPREGFVQATPDVLAALWKAIRDFEPDYLFCPPLASDPLAGVHLDHVGVAEAVRHVAYLINVPHVFSPEYPADETVPEPRKVPVILNVYDPYTAGANSFDLAVDVEPAFPLIARTSWCHQSQIREWLPWIGRHSGLTEPSSFEDWERILRQRFRRKNADLGMDSDQALEMFTVTGWGTVPRLETLLRDFPALNRTLSRLEPLEARLRRLGTV